MKFSTQSVVASERRRVGGRLILSTVKVSSSRGEINRSTCFYADEDYALYLHHLEELLRKFRCAVHAYALMTNHVYLLLTPARKDGPLMKHLGQRYVQ